MAKDKKRVVGQSNELIQKAIYSNLDINDLKLFKTIISKINYNDTLFAGSYQIDYEELDMVGIKKSNRFATVTQCLKKLSSTFVMVEDANGDPVELGLIKNEFTYPKNTSTIKVMVSENLKPHLLDLKQKYTKYDLEYLLDLKTVGNIKLYEFLRSFLKLGSCEVTVANLRKTLEVEDDKYPQYGNFKQKILSPYLKKINDTTDIKVTFEEILGFAKKVSSVKFTIVSKDQEDNDYDLSKLIDKILIVDGTKVIVRGFTPSSEHKGKYFLDMFNLDKYEDCHFQPMERKELYTYAMSLVKKES